MFPASLADLDPTELPHRRLATESLSAPETDISAMTGARPLPPALRILGAHRDHAADAAILAALPHVPPDAQSAAVVVLCRRKHEPALKALVCAYNALSPSAKSELCKNTSLLHHVLEQLVASRDVGASENALQLVVDSKDARLAHLLADAVRSAKGSGRDIAAKGLVALSSDAVAANARPEIATAGEVTARNRAIVEALQSVVHQFDPAAASAPVEAALWLGDQVEPVLLEKVREPNSRLAARVCEVLGRATDPRLAGAVLRALATPELRTAAITAITANTDADFLRALVRESWLLTDAEVRSGLLRVPEGAWMDRLVSAVGTFDEPTAIAAVRLLGGVGGSPDRKWNRLRPLLEASRPSVRREAFWQLVADPSGTANDLLRTLAASQDAQLRELAARESRRRLAAQGLPSPQPTIAAPIDPLDALFAKLDEIPPGKHSELLDPIRHLGADLLPRIRAKLSASDPLDRCRGIRLARSLALLPQVAERVYAMANDPERIVRAAVVSALAELPGPTSARLLRTAMHDPDERVQANAIESLDQLKVADRADILRPKLASPSNRVRANAIRALLHLEVREAGEALLDMLADTSNAHRSSALWVIERLQLQAVMRRVTDMSEHDNDLRVRHRATRIVHQLGRNPSQRRRTNPLVIRPREEKQP